MNWKSAVVISLGMVLAAAVFGVSFYEARDNDASIKVVGSATKRFDADTVKWQIMIARRSGTDRLAESYKLIREDLEHITERLVEAGLDPAAILVQPLTTNPMFGREGVIDRYDIKQSLLVISEKIGAIETLALNPDAIVSRGIVLENSQLEYFYTDLDNLKRELLAEAARDARLRAEEIASSSENMSVGNILDARAGIFQITEPYSTEVAAYGLHRTSTREKDIRVTVHMEFALE